jgi:hypothetical protein
MFYLDKTKTLVVDTQNKIVGQITKEGKFSQLVSDHEYRKGLSSLELEQISEILQRSKK